MVHIKKSNDRDDHNVHNENDGAENEYDIFRVVCIVQHVSHYTHRLYGLKRIVIVILVGNDLAVILVNKLHRNARVLGDDDCGADGSVYVMLLALRVLFVLTVVVHIPKSLELGENNVIIGRMSFCENSYDGDAFCMLVKVTCRVTGMNGVSNLEVAVFCYVCANDRLHRFACLKHFAIGYRFVFKVIGRCTDHAIAVVAVRHGKGNDLGYSLILLQRRYNRVGNGTNGRFIEVHRVHGKLRVASCRTYNGRIILCAGCDTLVNLRSDVKGKHTDSGGDYNGEYDQNDLHLLDRHVFKCEF